MVGIDDRPAEVAGRRVPGHWEADLIIGARGASAAITLVERSTRFVTILALPKGKDSTGVCDALIDYVTGLPDLMRGSLTWDQGTEMHLACRVDHGHRPAGVLRSPAFPIGTWQ
jgi:integrase family protein